MTNCINLTLEYFLKNSVYYVYCDINYYQYKYKYAFDNTVPLINILCILKLNNRSLIFFVADGSHTAYINNPCIA